jgi:hypothetical protein
VFANQDANMKILDKECAMSCLLRFSIAGLTLSLFSILSLAQAPERSEERVREVDQAPQPPAVDYIFNTNVHPGRQPNASFNISGSGSVGTTYQIGGTTVLRVDLEKENTFIGSAGPVNDGQHNTFLGQYAGAFSGEGKDNTFVGFDASSITCGVGLPTCGFSNTFFGSKAGFANTGYSNTFAGARAGSFNRDGYANSFYGQNAGGSNTTGRFNSYYGFQAGYNSTGSYNTFLGTESGLSAGDHNTVIGSFAGAGERNSGSDNTFLGDYSGGTSGDDNVYIGISAGIGQSGSNNIYIGATSSSPESNTIRIGSEGTGKGEQTYVYIAGIWRTYVGLGGTYALVNSDGKLGTPLSSRRFKEQIKDMGDSTNGLMTLRPVTFLYRPEYADGDRTRQYGLVAEEVAKVYPELVTYDKDGKPYSVRYQ